MLLLGDRSAAKALAYGLLSVLLGAAVALWLRFVALDVHGVSSPAAEPLKALQSGAFGALPRSLPKQGQWRGHQGHFSVALWRCSAAHAPQQ